MTFALSDSNRLFGSECNHTHEERCTSCMKLASVLAKILEATERKEWENKDAVTFKVEKSILAINQLQKHLVRAKNQEKARTDLVNALEENDVLITCDWAMKFLPRRFREGQMDWFAKRGINWHIAVSLIKLKSGLKIFTQIHIFNSQCSQDAATTTAILCDLVDDLKKVAPGLGHVHLISDNAGCYKSSLTLSTLHFEVPQLITYDFSESQNGKGPCDRKAANAKAVIKRYINEGRDVTTADDMKKALDRAKKGYMVKVFDAVVDIDADRQKSGSVQQLSNFFNFRYEKDGLRVWQAYGIGNGKLIPWKTLSPSKKPVELVVIRDVEVTVSNTECNTEDEIIKVPKKK